MVNVCSMVIGFGQVGVLKFGSQTQTALGAPQLDKLGIILFIPVGAVFPLQFLQDDET
jgi:hypothetical protein